MESLVRVQMEGKGAKQEQEVLGLKVTSSKTATAGVPGHSAALRLPSAGRDGCGEHLE